MGVLVLAEFGKNPGLEERLDQSEHPLVLDSYTHPIHQSDVVDGVKARLDVRIQHPPVTGGAEPVNLSNRVVCSPHRPEPVGDRHEVGLEDRFQHQLQRRLDNPVRHRRNPEAANLSRPARFGDLALPHRQRPERARLELGAKVVQEPRCPDLLLDVSDREAVHASGPGPGIARDPVERHDQRRRITHEVEQIVEPAAGVGRRPTVKLGLHLRYPPARPHRGPVVRSATVRWCLFRHYSIRPFSKLLPPFPMCTGSPRLGVLRRLRPVSTRSVDDGPSPTTALAARMKGRGSRRFPCSLSIRSTKEEPNSVPAASPRLPRSTSPWPPESTSTCPPRSSPPTFRRVRTAPGPYPPDWSR